MAVKLVKDRQSAKGTRSDPFGMRELRGMEEGGQGEGGMAKLVESAAREVLSAAIITGVLALFISSLLVTRLHLLIHGLTPLEHMAVGKFKAELLQQIHHAFPDAHHHQNSLPVDYCSRISTFFRKKLRKIIHTIMTRVLTRDPTRPDPDPISSPAGSGSGSANLNLTRPAPTRNYIRVGFGHCFPTRTRPGFIPSPKFLLWRSRFAPAQAVPVKLEGGATSPWVTSSDPQHQAELWSRARLRPRAVDTGQNLSTQQDETAPKCATPPCKSTKKPISGRVDPATVKENVIHHRATISTKPSGSLRARDCTPHGPKASPVPQKLKNTQASQKTTEKSPNPPPQKKEKSVETPEQHSKLPFPNQKHETKPSRPVPKGTVHRRPKQPTSQSGDSASRWLAAHNEIRERYSVGNLVWSSKLEASAQAWANRCVFEHSHGEAGENIAAGQPTIASVVKDWVYGDNECEAYDPNRPVYSHFTQVVWRDTSRLGCAVSTCSNLPGTPLQDAPFYVCQYSSAGNVLGEFDTNVLAKAGQCLK
ncbi:hypothetical protein PTTG_02614 [Puccinia triticina 1-1 BBBD Race 1]|uniref:SCP domain-containing protein n=1 Tax=Puccinia triticina (isolate 1-1 / race 1 (BBBD)) TaxID=630390 RepID=A0A0C4EPB3_PUCT1|nr:hypothetical protein PTTG_02614 [Puccinia triticina 1-1 BBBD Race 1]